MSKEDLSGLFWSILAWLVGIWAVLVFVLPRVAMLIDGKTEPLPIPFSALAMYAVVLATGIFFYVSSDEDRLAAFLRPLAALFEPAENQAQRRARKAVLVALPLLAAYAGYAVATPELGEITSVRIQHPTIPPAYAKLENPVRKLGPEEFQAALLEGRELFEINCRACHGDWTGGDGPMARGFRLKPANFTDPGTIATVVEAYAFWRIKEGGRGLPASATPWDSAMPVWKDELTDEQIWKIITAEYDLAGVEPRRPEKLE